jgi:hypothetical protein
MRTATLFLIYSLLIDVSLAHLSGTPLVAPQFPHKVLPAAGNDERAEREPQWETGQTIVQKEFDVLDYVDPLIGTGAGGHVFPGATMPFGMNYATVLQQIS